MGRASGRRKASKISLKTPINTVQCYIEEGNLVIRSRAGLLKTLSSAVLNGGLCFVKTILNHQVPKNFNNPDPASYLNMVASKLKLLTPVVGLMTAADISNLSIHQSKNHENPFCIFTTAGLSNAATAGDVINQTNFSFASTINIVVLIDGNLTDSCMVDAVKTVTEAKTVALRELDVRSRFSWKPASGTTTDAIVVACTGRGKLVHYAGTATALGEGIGGGVIKSVKDAVEKGEKLVANRPLVKRLEENGITFEDLVKTALELLVYHPNMGSKEYVVQVLRECLQEALSDVNVAALVMAGVRLNDDGKVGLIPGLTREAYVSDPVYILADEILGMSIANYIAGSRGVFEFTRFDKAKPGLLKKLEPFLDDAIGGLIAGASSKMYTKLLGGV
ncbi:MAG: phosphatidylglycerophosphatase A [Candidatus Bathyarchaeota archaeon]|nr:phosphatidylglycerophosphatase A [Candidatus Bathyarchaeota archaeon]